MVSKRHQRDRALFCEGKRSESSDGLSLLGRRGAMKVNIKIPSNWYENETLGGGSGGGVGGDV